MTSFNKGITSSTSIIWGLWGYTISPSCFRNGIQPSVCPWEKERHGESCPQRLTLCYRRQLPLEMHKLQEGLQSPNHKSGQAADLPCSWPQSWSPEFRTNSLHSETPKHNLKRKAADGDQPTKYLASEAVSGMGLEARTKVGCQLSSLNRMVQKSYCLRSGDNQQIQRIIDNYDEYTSMFDYEIDFILRHCMHWFINVLNQIHESKLFAPYQKVSKLDKE